MGLILRSIQSLLTRGKVNWLTGQNQQVLDGVSVPIESARGAFGGIPVGQNQDYPDNPAGTLYFNDLWASLSAPFAVGGGASYEVVAGVLSISQAGPATDLQVCTVSGALSGKVISARVAKRSSSAAIKIMSYDGVGFTTLATNSEVLPDNEFFTISATCPPGTTLAQITRFGSGYLLIDWLYVGDGSYANIPLEGGLLQESWPGTATDTLPEWHRTLGVQYDPLARSVADQQTMLAAMETAIGGSTLELLQAQFDKEFLPAGRIVVSEAYLTGITGQAVCGVARCGVSTALIYELGYDITGTILSSTEAARVAAIIARYGPAHLTPNSLLSDPAAIVAGITGLGRTGLARTGRAS